MNGVVTDTNVLGMFTDGRKRNKEYASIKVRFIKPVEVISKLYEQQIVETKNNQDVEVYKQRSLQEVEDDLDLKYGVKDPRRATIESIDTVVKYKVKGVSGRQRLCYTLKSIGDNSIRNPVLGPLNTTSNILLEERHKNGEYTKMGSRSILAQNGIVRGDIIPDEDPVERILKSIGRDFAFIPKPLNIRCQKNLILNDVFEAPIDTDAKLLSPFKKNEV